MSKIFDKEIRITEDAEDERKEKKRQCSNNSVLFFVSLFSGVVAISLVLRIFMVISGAV